MKKKRIILALAVMCMMATGCGNKETTDTTALAAADTTSEATTTVTEEPATHSEKVEKAIENKKKEMNEMDPENDEGDEIVLYNSDGTTVTYKTVEDENGNLVTKKQVTKKDTEE